MRSHSPTVKIIYEIYCTYGATVDFRGSDRRVRARVCARFGGPFAGSAAEKSPFPVLVAAHRCRRDAALLRLCSFFTRIRYALHTVFGVCIYTTKFAGRTKRASSDCYFGIGPPIYYGCSERARAYGRPVLDRQSGTVPVYRTHTNK